jgi:eukaryotic-like serine/threonine-protein kinase
MSLFQLEAGRIINREFVIEGPLSEGGMGAVFVALQQSTGVRRALKVLHPEFVQDPKVRKRFEQEARVGSKIASDHVVQVISAGIDADGDLPFLVMELLGGQTLAERIEQQGRVDTATFLALFEQLCHALGAAHQGGIVHRDVKPENLFLAQSRTVGIPFILKVLDFGIAKMVAESGTRPTQSLGTPLWAAPEQTQLGAKIGPATDVWSLGLVAFYCLTGKDYWRFAERSWQMAMREILEGELLAPEERARELGVSLPAGFGDWFRGCVQREPAARFANASVAHAELRRCLSAPAATRFPATEPMPESFELGLAPTQSAFARSNRARHPTRFVESASPPDRAARAMLPTRLLDPALRGMEPPTASGRSVRPASTQERVVIPPAPARAKRPGVLGPGRPVLVSATILLGFCLLMVMAFLVVR